LPEKFFDSARKNFYANLQNHFARLTPPSKKSRISVTISLDRMKILFFVSKTQNIIFHFWLLASARKI